MRQTRSDADYGKWHQCITSDGLFNAMSFIKCKFRDQYKGSAIYTFGRISWINCSGYRTIGQVSGFDLRQGLKTLFGVNRLKTYVFV